MKQYREDCSFCRLMRSLAFTGLAMGLGAGVASLFDVSRIQMVYTGMIVAAILVFGILGLGRNNTDDRG